MSRILFLSDATIYGGAENAMFTAAEALARKRVTVAVGVPASGERHRSRLNHLERMGAAIVTADGPLAAGLHGLLSARLRRGAARRAARLIEHASPDAVVVNLPTVERGAALVDAAEMSGCRGRVAGYVHLGQLPSTFGARLGWLRDRLVPRHLARFAVLLAVCDTTAATLRPVARGATVPVYPGSRAVRKTDWLARAEARRRLGLADSPTIGLLGRVDFHHKGQDAAVRIAAALRRRGSRARWVVVGDGPDLPALRVLVHRHGLNDVFHVLGWRDDVLDVLPAFDVLAMPSRYEGLPLTAVEGIAARVPVVAFAVDGLSELLQPPFAVPPRDEAAFADALALVLDDPARWPAEERAALVARLCDPAAVADRILEALQLTPAA